MKNKKLLLLPTLFAISSLAGCGASPEAPKHAELGMSKREVMNVLGDPSVTKDGKWYYYDAAFFQKYTLMNQLINSSNEAERIRGYELKSELETQHIFYRFLEFTDEKVSKYLYDTNHKFSDSDSYATWENKNQTSASLSNSSNMSVYKERDVLHPVSDSKYTSEVYFSDGSIYRANLTGKDVVVVKENRKYNATWGANSFIKGSVTLDNVSEYDGYIHLEFLTGRGYDPSNYLESSTGEGFYNDGDDVTLSVSVKEGFKNKNWFTSNSQILSTDSLTCSFEFSGTGYQKIYFDPDLINYTITYHLDGGTNSVDNPSTYTVIDIVSLSDPHKEGFVFKGWVDNNGNKVAGVDYGHTGDLEITATWEAATLKTIYLNYDGAVLFEGTSTYQEGYLDYPYGEPTKPDTEDKVYEFVQWTKVSEVNYTVTYKAEYEEYSKDELLQQYIASMNLKIKQRTEFVKAANETREVSAIQLLCFQLSNVGRYVHVEFDVDFDGETGWNHSAWFKIELSEDDYRDLSDILYNAEIISTDSPITENYTFDEIRGIYNIIFKGKDLVTTEVYLDGSPWKMHYPEIPDEVRFDIDEIQDKCFDISAGYTTIDGEMVLITEYSNYDCFPAKSATIVKYSYKDYLAIEGKVRLGVRDEQSNMVYEEATLKVVLKVEATRLAKFAQYTEDVELVGETLIENYDPVQIMYLNNCVMHNDTTGYKYYLNGKSFTPEDY